MRGRWWIVAACAPFALLIIDGAHRRHSRRGPETTVAAFAQALQRGDASAAAGLLVAEARESARRRSAARTADWTASPGLTWRLTSLTLDGDAASAGLQFTEAGTVLRPVLSLRREPEGWKIARIDGLDLATASPGGDDFPRDERDVATGIELERALRDRPGAVVERPDDGSRDRR